MNKDAFLITEKRPLVIHEAQKSALHHRKWKMIKFFHGSSIKKKELITQFNVLQEKHPLI